MKLIYAKYDARCGGCNTKISAGSKCYWEKGKKALCVNCMGKGIESPASAVSATAPKSSKDKNPYNPDFVIDWPELRELIKLATREDTVASDLPFRVQRNAQRFYSDLRPAYNSWEGFSRASLHEWVTSGFKTDAIQGLGMPAPIREKRRTRYVEDGDEFHFDRAFAGEDNFMSTATKREVIPGVRLNIELDASAGSSDMLFPYQRWIAQTIYSLEMSGVDCEVNIYTLSRGLFASQPQTAREMVRVKKEGEIADFAGFSAMFSPAAFRGIMFALMALQADRQSLRLLGYGAGVTTKWGVKYTSSTKSIDVACNWTAHSFPEGMMTSALKKAIADMKADV